MKRLLFDVEADGLLDTITKHHCGAAEDLDTGERFEWGPTEIPRMLEVFDQADVLAGHHIQGYDIPSLTVVHGWKPRPTVKLRDTYLCARVIHPDLRDKDDELIVRGTLPKVSPSDGKPMRGRHTIEAWGYRIGIPKVGTDITNWAEWTQAIQDRCVGDVTTNVKLYRHLGIDSYSQIALDLEHRISLMCEAMTAAGWPFDMAAAEALYSELVGRRDAVEKQLVEQFGFWYSPISPNPAKYTFTPKKDNAKLGYVAGAPCSKIEKITFNPGSTQHIAKVLMARGWKPTQFTPGGKPTVDESVINGELVAQFPEAAGLAEYLMVNKRLSQLADGDQGWMKVVGEDGRVHASYNPMGTVTSRASHFKPNIGQVPNSAAPYGPECRDLFTVLPGFVLVGADQQGLELRCLAHYLAKKDGGKYGEAVCTGDPHWMTVRALGFTQDAREKGNVLHDIFRESGAKRWLYAKIYGCGKLKSGMLILECCQAALKEGFDIFPLFFKSKSPKESEIKRVGGDALTAFADKIDGLKKLQEQLGVMAEHKGRIPGLDGRIIPARSSHSALNFLLQSAGAILCKQWACDAFEYLCSKYQHGWSGDFVFLGWIHDELQVAARKGLEDEIGETLVRFARTAGEPFGFRVPLDSKYKVGSSWRHTH